MNSGLYKKYISKSPCNMHEGKEHVDTYEPPVIKYKEGDVMSEKDAYPIVDEQVHNFQGLSKIKKDGISQFMTIQNLDTKETDTIRPRSGSPKFFKTEND
tara:strand:+ start:244 stop:543 length:300 start_codon:yes stop_codon:yes gene_type:complete